MIERLPDRCNNKRKRKGEEDTRPKKREKKKKRVEREILKRKTHNHKENILEEL